MLKPTVLLVISLLMVGSFLTRCYAQNVHEKSIYLLRNQGIDSAISFVEGNSQKSLYDYGLELIFLGKTEEALEWYVELTKKYDNPKYFYGKAWAHWVRNEFRQARIDGEEILKSDAPTIIKARAHYLLGKIHLENQDLTLAANHAEACEQLYEELGKNGGLYLANILHASIAILDDRYEEGESFLKKAAEHNNRLKSPYSEGKTFELKAEIAWLKKDFSTSLEYATLSRDAYLEENDEVSGWHLSARVGLLKAIMGDFESAYTITKVVEATAKGKKLDNLLMYNHITWIFMDRCKGYDFQPRKNEIERWVKFRGDGEHLTELLNYIEEIPCP